MDNWAIAFVIRNGKYDWVDAGKDMVMTQEYDKVIPVREEVARQVEKLEYNGKTLKLKEGETLLSLEELNQQQYDSDLLNGLIVNEEQAENEQNKIVEVEL